jgi:penicillin-binding protein 2
LKGAHAAATPGDARLMDDVVGRLNVLGVIGVALVLTLLVRLWWLQVVSGSELESASTSDRIRVVHDEAPRGRIFDRQGDDVLVDNRERIVVGVDPQVIDALDAEDGGPSREVVLDRLAAALTMSGTTTTADTLEATIGDPAADPLRPVPVAVDVPESLEVFLLERRDQLPGVEVSREAVRTYPYGTVAAHVLGYVGQINDEELAAHEDEERTPYRLGDEIGKAGIEASFEEHLRGVPGQRTYEVDASGEVVRLVAEQSFPPVAGYDLRLAIDVDVQAYVEGALAATVDDVDAEKGSVVVEDPQDGTIVAMASNPTYAPEELVEGISTERYAELTSPASGFPLNNWAVQGQYAPASTFKLVTGWAGMTAGLRSPTETWNDQGSYVAEGCSSDDESCRFNNDGETVWGTVDLRRALTVSSDTYFYSLGDRFWLGRDERGEEAMQDLIEEWGFGEQTGVDLPAEISGLVNTPAMKAERHEAQPDAFPYGEWFTGDNINMSIGQGDLLVTPMQLTNAYAAFANGGTLREPQIALEVWEQQDESGPRVVESFEAEVLNEIDIPQDQYDAIRDGLLGVVSGSEGTAREAFEGFDLGRFPVAGKTGTAQVASQESGNALFVGYGPVNEFPAPRYAVTAIVENTEEYGGQVAAPLVRSIFDVLATPALLPQATRATS